MRYARSPETWGMAYSTVRDWLVRMHREGAAGGGLTKNARGKRRSVAPEALRFMRRALGSLPEKHGFESGAWSLGMVGAPLKREFGIVCPPRTFWRTLRRMGFSHIKPRPIPIKSARARGAGGVQGRDAPGDNQSCQQGIPHIRRG